MWLANGTLEIPDPEEALRSYLDPSAGSAWPAYDDLVTNGSTELVDGDLLAPTLLHAPVDSGRFRALKEMWPHLVKVADLPPVALQDADDAVIDAVAELFAGLDSELLRRSGVRGSIVAKVLHRKRPDLIPLYDSRIFDAYTAAGALPRAPNRSQVDLMRLVCQQMRADLRSEATRFAELQRSLADADVQLSQLRILDILVWMTASAWA
jgi:hypothetical protein